MFENLDTLTLILIVAIAIFLIAAIVLIIMLATSNRDQHNSRPGFVTINDRTLSGSNTGRRRSGATSAMIVCISGKQQGKKAGFRSGGVGRGEGSAGPSPWDVTWPRTATGRRRVAGSETSPRRSG